MGWPKGLGRLLLVDTLRLLQPQLVLQLQLDSAANNYSDLMMPDVVMRDRGWVSGNAVSDCSLCAMTMRKGKRFLLS